MTTSELIESDYWAIHRASLNSDGGSGLFSESDRARVDSFGSFLKPGKLCEMISDEFSSHDSSTHALNNLVNFYSNRNGAKQLLCLLYILFF